MQLFLIWYNMLWNIIILYRFLFSFFKRKIRRAKITFTFTDSHSHAFFMRPPRLSWYRTPLEQNNRDRPIFSMFLKFKRPCDSCLECRSAYIKVVWNDLTLRRTPVHFLLISWNTQNKFLMINRFTFRFSFNHVTFSNNSSMPFPLEIIQTASLSKLRVLVSNSIHVWHI